MTNNNPIGIFDSGVGGLSVAKSIREILPNEGLLYIADSKYAPYGDKNAEFIYQRSRQITEFLVKSGAKMVVIACNTATVSTVEDLRAEFSIPIVGVEPGVKPAVNTTKTGFVGILATQQTVESEKFNDLVALYQHEAEVIPQACPGLVEAIEDLSFDTPELRDLIESYTEPLIKRQVDTLVLGCTHYAFIEDTIRSLVADDIQFVTTHDAVAKQVARRLVDENLEMNCQDAPADQFWTSKQELIESGLVSKLWGNDVVVKNFPY